VLVSGEVRGLAPSKEHGFHVHEKGDCSSGDGLSTGGHFNPTGKPHGAHAQDEHHAGDLVSLRADANGVAKFSYTSTTISVGSGPADVIGRGLIVHRDPDDFKTQPTGNSGPRIACAVIAKSNV
jgi:Cu-Zn family superoxide dismutase